MKQRSDKNKTDKGKKGNEVPGQRKERNCSAGRKKGRIRNKKRPWRKGNEDKERTVQLTNYIIYTLFCPNSCPLPLKSTSF
jgi:hypothetical protein